MEETGHARQEAESLATRLTHVTGATCGAEVPYSLKTGVRSLAKRWLVDAVSHSYPPLPVIPSSVIFDLIWELNLFCAGEITRAILERGYLQVGRDELQAWVCEVVDCGRPHLAEARGDRIRAYWNADYDDRLDAFAKFAGKVVPPQFGPPRLLPFYCPALYAGCRLLTAVAFADERGMQEFAQLHTGMLQLAERCKLGMVTQNGNRTAPGCAVVILAGFVGLMSWFIRGV